MKRIVVTALVVLAAFSLSGCSFPNLEAEAKVRLAWQIVPIDEKYLVCEGYRQFGEPWVHETTAILVDDPDMNLNKIEGEILTKLIVDQCSGG